jgi:hypothetical protein
MLSRVRSAIAEPTAGFWTDVEIYTYINDGIVSMCDKRGISEVVRAVVHEEKRIAIPIDPTEMTYIDKVFLYSVDVTLTFSETQPAAPTTGDAWIKPSDMSYQTWSGTAWTVADLVSKSEITSGFEIVDGFINFTSERTGLLELEGYRIPAGLSADVLDCELPEPYVLGVVEYAIARAASKDENKPKMEEHMANFFRIKRQWEARRGYKKSRFVDRWYQ